MYSHALLCFLMHPCASLLMHSSRRLSHREHRCLIPPACATQMTMTRASTRHGICLVPRMTLRTRVSGQMSSGKHTAFAFVFSMSSWLRHCLCLVFSMSVWLKHGIVSRDVRHSLCPVFSMSSWLRHCLCLVFSMSSWLRHCLCLVFSMSSWLKRGICLVSRDARH